MTWARGSLERFHNAGVFSRAMTPLDWLTAGTVL